MEYYYEWIFNPSQFRVYDEMEDILEEVKESY